MVDGKLIVNPNYEESKVAKINIVVAGTEEGIVMVESGAQQASEAEVLAAIQFGHECCKKIAKAIRELVAKCGKKKAEYAPAAINQPLYDQIAKTISADLKDALNTQKHEKLESYALVSECKHKVIDPLPEEQKAEAKKLFDALKEKIFRDEMLKERRRPDGRAFDQVRKIDVEVGVLPRTHGSSLFTRGETQALVTCTLGTKDDEQRIELLDSTETSKRFMLHYNFPPFSVGEVGFMRGAGRREIGPGALAERAISAVIPDDKVPLHHAHRQRHSGIERLQLDGLGLRRNPFADGRRCADHAAPVAGIAMGLVKEGDAWRRSHRYRRCGADHYGDMDFKVAGTKSGITALQMDIKVPNVTHAILTEALEQARRARLHILEKMVAVISTPRDTLSAYAPRIFTLQIPTDQIRELIGPGGKVIRGIVEATGCKIDVEDDGSVKIFSSDGAAADRCIQMVTDICAVAEIGKTYLGKVVRIVVDFRRVTVEICLALVACCTSPTSREPVEHQAGPRP